MSGFVVSQTQREAVYKIERTLAKALKSEDFRASCVQCRQVIQAVLEHGGSDDYARNLESIFLTPYPEPDKTYMCILCKLVRAFVPPVSHQRLLGLDQKRDPTNRRYFLRLRDSLVKRDTFIIGRVYDDGQYHGDIHASLGESRGILNALSPGKLVRWLIQCEADHPESQHVSKNLEMRNSRPMDTGDAWGRSPKPDRDAGSSQSATSLKAQELSMDLTLIDVADRRLRRGSSKDRYLALSYVWGGVQTLQLITSNRAALEIAGAISEDNLAISRTIRDAIKLVRQMGEIYLWVDCLCIEQNNTVQKHFQISRMDVVYSHALATIVPLSNANAADPIPGVGFGTRLPLSSEWMPEQISAPSPASETRGILFGTYPPVLEGAMTTSAYENRGWTLQERLLSRRCIYLTNHTAYFSCHHGKLLCDADKLLPTTRQEDFGPQSSLRAIIDPLTFGITNYLAKASFAPYVLGYAILVQQYTQRDLSFGEDKLNAFSGILAKLTKPFPGSSIGGLPEYLLDYALLWFDCPLDRHPDIYGRDRRFPSWSWAGWKGRKIYDLESLFMNEETLPEVLQEERSLEIGLITELRDIGTSYQTPIRPLSRVTDNTNRKEPSTKPTAMSYEILHFSTEATNMENIQFVEVGGPYGLAMQFAGRRNCGRVYHCLWPSFHHQIRDGDNISVIELNRLINERNIEIILLSRSSCPLHAPYESTDVSLRLSYYTDPEYCLKVDCYLLYVMFIEWHGDHAERLAIGNMQIGAWRQLDTYTKNVVLH